MRQKRGLPGIERLSPRERQVHELKTAGQNLSQIATTLGITRKMAYVHWHNLRLKIDPEGFKRAIRD